MEQEITIPKITNEFEKFDIEKFNKKVDGKTRKRKVLNETFYLEEEPQNPGYISRKYLNDSYFMISKKFFENGNIKQKAISFINGYPIKEIYEFDENGTLIKTLNTDKGYDFDWRAVVAYCEGNKIPLTKGFKEFDGFQTRIFKNEIDDKKVWEITYQVSGDELSKITLDAKTGKELEKEKLEFINH